MYLDKKIAKETYNVDGAKKGRCVAAKAGYRANKRGAKSKALKIIQKDYKNDFDLDR